MKSNVIASEAKQSVRGDSYGPNSSAGGSPVASPSCTVTNAATKILSGNGFAKRFHLLALKEKMATVEKLDEWISQGRFGKLWGADEDEVIQMKALSKWCIKNIFLGTLPSALNEQK